MSPLLAALQRGRECRTSAFEPRLFQPSGREVDCTDSDSMHGKKESRHNSIQTEDLAVSGSIPLASLERMASVIQRRPDISVIAAEAA